MRAPIRAGAMALVLAITVLGSGCARTAPSVVPDGPTVTVSPPRPNPFGRKIAREERWTLSDTTSVEDLQGTTFGEQEINEFWTRKGWKLTKRDEAYLATVDALLRDGYITKVSRWSTCPYNPIYQALVGVDVLGAHVRGGQEFNLDMDVVDGVLHLGNPRFERAKVYEEDHKGGHASDSARR